MVKIHPKEFPRLDTDADDFQTWGACLPCPKIKLS